MTEIISADKVVSELTRSLLMHECFGLVILESTADFGQHIAALAFG